ncbi:MAG: AmmeMemoRadiSam system protein A [Caldicoprobacterales bacterium]|jgi:AmmeMemoRadiSam system protein A|nr:AmmeMemoRadiSam system protein A [Clostridiales bacterium]
MGNIYAYYALPHPPIIIPEVGRGEETAIQETIDAFYQVSNEVADLKPDTVIMVTPHGPVFQDAVAIMRDMEIGGSMRRFRAPQVRFKNKIDMDLTDEILDMAQKMGIPTVEITKSSEKKYGVSCELDHGSMVPMYFINQKYSDYQLVHITYGLLSPEQLYQFGICVKKAVEQIQRSVVFIASGDLSHRLIKEGPYEFSPYGEKFDSEIRSLLEQGDVHGVLNMDTTMVREAGECALRSYYILLGALDSCEFKGQTLSYQGTFGVGYLVMRFDVRTAKQQNPYVRLARASLTHYLLQGDYMSIPSYVTQEMRNQKRSAFVTLKKSGNLRGCIGTIKPVTNSLAEEIIRNAVEAGTCDPRFPPVTKEELKYLEISVDVLTEPEPAQFNQLDPKKYGIIVRSGYRSGLLLPDLEGVDTAEEQLYIALKKAGISPRSPYSIEKFQVIRYREEKP